MPSSTTPLFAVSASGPRPLQPVPPHNGSARAAEVEYTGKRAATRDRLMNACATLIVRDGFDVVSMTSVAEEAGITRQTVYRYFPNAREVIRSTLLRGGRELLEGQILVFQQSGDPGELFIEAVMSALSVIQHNPLLRTAWDSRDYTQAVLRSIFDPGFTARGVDGLRPLAARLGWSEAEIREAYDMIARTIASYLTIPPVSSTADSDLRDLLRRRLLPALGLPH